MFLIYKSICDSWQLLECICYYLYSSEKDKESLCNLSLEQQEKRFGEEILK